MPRKRHDLLVQEVLPARGGWVKLVFGCNACPGYRNDETVGRTEDEARERAAGHIERHAGGPLLPQLRKALSRP